MSGKATHVVETWRAGSGWGLAGAATNLTLFNPIHLMRSPDFFNTTHLCVEKLIYKRINSSVQQTRSLNYVFHFLILKNMFCQREGISYVSCGILVTNKNCRTPFPSPQPFQFHWSSTEACLTAGCFVWTVKNWLENITTKLNNKRVELVCQNVLCRD